MIRFKLLTFLMFGMSFSVQAMEISHWNGEPFQPTEARDEGALDKSRASTPSTDSNNAFDDVTGSSDGSDDTSTYQLADLMKQVEIKRVRFQTAPQQSPRSSYRQQADRDRQQQSTDSRPTATDRQQIVEELVGSAIKFLLEKKHSPEDITRDIQEFWKYKQSVRQEIEEALVSQARTKASQARMEVEKAERRHQAAAERERNVDRVIRELKQDMSPEDIVQSVRQLGLSDDARSLLLNDELWSILLAYSSRN